MASKNHVDSSVAERRLRPIYNWLDDGNNKKALQETEKVLKKQPNFQCAKVLKGLALLRLGKDDECQQLLESVRKDLQCDDATLQAMTICYRELNKPEAICEVYLAATQKDPKNEELLTHLFMAYVRVCDYKKQQQTAMALYKLKLKNHYYFWTVMSIVMQAYESQSDLAKNIQLPLAEKMVKKFVDDGKIEAEQEVQLYVMILEMQNKLEEALAAVEGPLGEMLHSYIAVPNKRIELLIKMECWRRANIEIKKLLVDDMDNWSLYLNYFKTVFHIIKVESNGVTITEDNSADKTVDDCVQFLRDIYSKNQKKTHQLRGPYLAFMEFFIQLQDNTIDAELHFGFFTDLLLDYFRNFGSKTCCLNDLRPYLDKLNDSQVTIFLDEAWKFIELEDGQLPTSKEQMLKYISNLHITRYLGFHEKLNVEAKIQLADCLLRYYTHGAQFNSSPILPTDIRHNDPFIILIVEIMNDVWLETNDACYLKNAIVVLEHALEKSPSNHQFKILLIKLYNTLGISKAAQKVYELLDVKHVQLDSMGYLQCWPLISNGQYLIASHMFEITLKFFTSNYKDSADHLTFLYKFGSFLKIQEFIEFRERLNNSLHYTAVTIEKMLMEIMQTTSYQGTLERIEQMSIHPERESIEFNKLEDNRDLDLCWTSGPKERQLSKELLKMSFEHDLDYLKIRSLILRVIAAAVQLASNTNKSMNGTNDVEKTEVKCCKTLESLCDELSGLSRSIQQKNYSRLPKNVINSPMDSRLFYLLEVPYIELVESMVSMLLAISKNDEVEMKNISDNEKNPVTNLNEAISLLNTECKSTDHTQLGLRSRILNLLTLLVEMGSIATLFSGASCDIVKTHTGHQVKKSRKKKESTTPPVQVNKGENDKQSGCVNTVQRLISFTSSALEDLEKIIVFIEDKWREPVNSENEVSNLIGLLSLEDKPINAEESCGFQKTVLESYISSLSEIQYIIRCKSKYLLNLHL